MAQGQGETGREGLSEGVFLGVPCTARGPPCGSEGGGAMGRELGCEPWPLALQLQGHGHTVPVIPGLPLVLVAWPRPACTGHDSEQLDPWYLQRPRVAWPEASPVGM